MTPPLTPVRQPNLFFVVSGPCRDYDFSIFCSNHANAALEFAKEWLEEVWDAIDEDESRSITIEYRAGQERCYACQPLTKEEEEGLVWRPH